MLFAQNNLFCHKQHVPDSPAAKLSYTTAEHLLVQALQEYCCAHSPLDVHTLCCLTFCA